MHYRGLINMNTYFFTLVLQNAGVQRANLEDLLFEAGCADALICSYNNTIYLEFDRTETSANKAISSAIYDITAAGLHIASIQEGGVASMAEIANRAGLTRAAINNYCKAVRGPGNFPEPLFGLTSGSPLYSWPDVAQWLHQHGKVSHNLVAVSQAAQQLSPHLAKETN